MCTSDASHCRKNCARHAALNRTVDNRHCLQQRQASKQCEAGDLLGAGATSDDGRGRSMKNREAKPAPLDHPASGHCYTYRSSASITIKLQPSRKQGKTRTTMSEEPNAGAGVASEPITIRIVDQVSLGYCTGCVCFAEKLALLTMSLTISFPCSSGMPSSLKGGEETHLKVKKTTKMAKIFNAYAQRKNVNRSSLRFLLDGDVVGDENTPKTLELEDEDVSCFVCWACARRVDRVCEKERNRGTGVQWLELQSSVLFLKLYSTRVSLVERSSSLTFLLPSLFVSILSSTYYYDRAAN